MEKNILCDEICEIRKLKDEILYYPNMVNCYTRLAFIRIQLLQPFFGLLCGSLSKIYIVNSSKRKTRQTLDFPDKNP